MDACNHKIKVLAVSVSQRGTFEMRRAGWQAMCKSCGEVGPVRRQRTYAIRAFEKGLREEGTRIEEGELGQPKKQVGPGRPQLHETTATKQKAYRERKRQKVGAHGDDLYNVEVAIDTIIGKMSSNSRYGLGATNNDLDQWAGTLGVYLKKLEEVRKALSNI